METLGLVDDLGGDALQRILVRAGVVGAEHQFAACLEEHLDVRLSAAAVAAIVCREPGSFESEVQGSFLASGTGAGESPQRWFAGGATSSEPGRSAAAEGERRL